MKMLSHMNVADNLQRLGYSGLLEMDIPARADVAVGNAGSFIEDKGVGAINGEVGHARNRAGTQVRDAENVRPRPFPGALIQVVPHRVPIGLTPAAAGDDE